MSDRLTTPPRPPAGPPPSNDGGSTTETLASIGPVARSSVVDAVADRLRGEILAGRLPAGAKIPSERELSFALGVNRLTLRAALARLEALGLITTRHGSGTVVADWRERAGLDALASLIGSLTPLDPMWRELITSLLEVRRILAAEAIGLAAERRSKKDLETLMLRADEQKDRASDPVVFARGDVAFVRAIVHASRNLALELLLNTFARFPDEHPELAKVMFDRCEASLAYYPIVIELIERGDGDLARAVVRRELENLDEGWHKRHGSGAVGEGTKKPKGPKEPALKDGRVRVPKLTANGPDKRSDKRADT